MEVKPFIFPPVNGVENETRPTFVEFGANRQVTVHDIDYHLLMSCIWQEMGAIAEGITDVRFTKNGSKVYWDGRGPEIAGPECADPIEQNTYTVANDEMYLDGLIEYGIRKSELIGRPLYLSYNRRNTDLKGDAWATHDSVSIAQSYAEKVVNTTRSLKSGSQRTAAPVTILVKHLLRSSFLSGAGAITDSGPRFAQKIDTIKGFSDYAFSSTLYRTDTNQGARFEARANDRNMLNAGNVLRVGSAVLAAALGQTPLANELNDRTPITGFRQGSHYNYIPLGLDRMFQPVAWSSKFIDSADMELRFAEFAGEYLPHYMDVPSPYLRVAEAWYQVCEDFKSVVRRQATIDLLADRIGWARKMGLILDYSAEAPGERTIRDEGARQIDQQYALTTAKIYGKHGSIQHGQGVADRRDPNLPYTPSRRSVIGAYDTPPHTRAAARTKQILLGHERGDTVKADWHVVSLNGRHRTLRPRYVYEHPGMQRKSNRESRHHS